MPLLTSRLVLNSKIRLQSLGLGWPLEFETCRCKVAVIFFFFLSIFHLSFDWRAEMTWIPPNLHSLLIGIRIIRTVFTVQKMHRKVESRKTALAIFSSFCPVTWEKPPARVRPMLTTMPAITVSDGRLMITFSVSGSLFVSSGKFPAARGPTHEKIWLWHGTRELSVKFRT